jgi:hypothetical protein
MFLDRDTRRSYAENRNVVKVRHLDRGRPAKEDIESDEVAVVRKPAGIQNAYVPSSLGQGSLAKVGSRPGSGAKLGRRRRRWAPVGARA